MRECRTYGSERGATGNGRPYRDQRLGRPRAKIRLRTRGKVLRESCEEFFEVARKAGCLGSQSVCRPSSGSEAEFDPTLSKPCQQPKKQYDSEIYCKKNWNRSISLIDFLIEEHCRFTLTTLISCPVSSLSFISIASVMNILQTVIRHIKSLQACVQLKLVEIHPGPYFRNPNVYSDSENPNDG
jgi:hypothetical protein